ncbi:MAG: hypothetical protein EON90_09990 [Brevundimonas sp.]|nr:MAG: hypothetical protein EON90_09990 [Brevundimonas sp.]
MTGWTEERTAEAVRLWGQGKSASQIARILQRGLTRNAVIGKIHRLGLTAAGRDAPSKPGGGVAQARRPKAPTVPRGTTRPVPPRPGPQKRPAVIHGHKLGTDFLKSDEDAEKARALFRADGLSIADRVTAGAGVESPNARPFVEHERGCRWPIGPQGAVLLCCNPVARGPYCAGHAEVAYVGEPQPNAPGRINAMASHLARFDGIDLTANLIVRKAHGRDNRPNSTWDSGRAAA